MLSRRVIPTLLLDGERLVKTERFGSPVYVGDPINAVRIFNEKEVDELLLVDISARRAGRGPSWELVRAIVSEAFMPIGYGGGVRSVDDFSRLFATGVEKVAVNLVTAEGEVVRAASAAFGSQSLVVALDLAARRSLLRRSPGVGLYDHLTRKTLDVDPAVAAARAVELGAGELLVTSADREGTGAGLDLDVVRAVVEAVPVPVIAHGGVATVDHMAEGFSAGAAAVACGSRFVFHGQHRAVLISYLTDSERELLARAGE